ncbi:hypothetical protein SDC9_150737 [bioreactor metagenome]|uniref:Uncharacterized protein n=1 Tax=bioreactor metagenome TaxID=1076179 RepID=A0A645ENX8_9ZZZZ
MPGGKHGAAILVGEDGGLKGADVAGQADDLLLVHSDHRTQHRQGAHRLGALHGPHSLGGHLPQGFPRDQGAGPRAPGDVLRDAHHKPAHEYGEQLLGAVAAQLLLHLGKGHHMHREPAAPAAENAAQLQHLFLGLGRGVGVAEKMHQLGHRAPLGHHPDGHGAVDAPGKQTGRPAAHAQGQAAGAGLRVGVDEGGGLPHLQMNRYLRMVHIYL